MPMLHVCNQHENALLQSNEAEHCCHPVLHDISDVFGSQKQLISRNSITKQVFFALVAHFSFENIRENNAQLALREEFVTISLG